jgi:hypothetical protein
MPPNGASDREPKWIKHLALLQPAFPQSYPQKSGRTGKPLPIMDLGGFLQVVPSFMRWAMGAGTLGTR